MSVAPYKIRIYGTNTKFDSSDDSEVSIASINSAVDLTTIDVNCFAINPHYEEVGEVSNVGNILTESGVNRRIFNIECEPFSFKNNFTDFENLFTVLGKRNKFIEARTYPNSIHIYGNAIAVVLSGYEINSENGYKMINLDFKKRKPNKNII